MQNDLSAAKASVGWAVSQLPAFQSRLDVWLNANIYVTVKELPPDSPNNVILAMEREPLPLAFQVEAGAYINAIRSSLDILATTLARRYCPELIDDAYFPIVSSAATFSAGKYKGYKLINALPATERSIIESLKPYKGGNDLLYALHLLDIVRKHQRLLTTEVHPGRFSVMAWGLLSSIFTPVSTGWMRSGDDETVIGLLAKGAAQPQIDLTMQVSINESNYLEHRPIVTALSEFANLACSIINMFEAE